MDFIDMCSHANKKGFQPSEKATVSLIVDNLLRNIYEESGVTSVMKDGRELSKGESSARSNVVSQLRLTQSRMYFRALHMSGMDKGEYNPAEVRTMVPQIKASCSEELLACLLRLTGKGKEPIALDLVALYLRGFPSIRKFVGLEPEPTERAQNDSDGWDSPDESESSDESDSRGSSDDNSCDATFERSASEDENVCRDSRIVVKREGCGLAGALAFMLFVLLYALFVENCLDNAK